MNVRSARRRIVTLFAVGSVFFLGLALLSEGRQRVFFLLWLPFLTVQLLVQLRSLKRRVREEGLGPDNEV